VLPVLFSLALAVVVAQSFGQAQTTVLGTVRITTAVMANGAVLPPGNYEVRLTQERPPARSGQSADARQWVEFASGGKVVGREIAQVLRDGDLPATGASSRPVPSGTKVEMLKDGEFLRISIKRDRERYLIYLPPTK
jgi:hypothetical protein